MLPTDAPALAAAAAPLRLAMSPLLWSQHRPDCFDSYSAGVVLMQLALPFLRPTASLRTFNGTLARMGHDLLLWRDRSALPARQTALLDADGGAGWDLAAGLLRPREVELDGAGGVRFVSTGTAPRLTPAAALRHPYLKKVGTAKMAGAWGSMRRGPAACKTWITGLSRHRSRRCRRWCARRRG